MKQSRDFRPERSGPITIRVLFFLLLSALAAQGDEAKLLGAQVGPSSIGYHACLDCREPDHRIEVRAEVDSGGSINREEAERVFRSHLKEIRYCLESSKVSSAMISAEIEIRFAVDAKGKVSEPRGSGSAPTNLKECLIRRLRTWSFPSGGQSNSQMTAHVSIIPRSEHPRPPTGPTESFSPDAPASVQVQGALRKVEQRHDLTILDGTSVYRFVSPDRYTPGFYKAYRDAKGYWLDTIDIAEISDFPVASHQPYSKPENQLLPIRTWKLTRTQFEAVEKAFSDYGFWTASESKEGEPTEQPLYSFDAYTDGKYHRIYRRRGEPERKLLGAIEHCRFEASRMVFDQPPVTGHEGRQEEYLSLALKSLGKPGKLPDSPLTYRYLDTYQGIATYELEIQRTADGPQGKYLAWFSEAKDDAARLKTRTVKLTDTEFSALEKEFQNVLKAQRRESPDPDRFGHVVLIDGTPKENPLRALYTSDEGPHRALQQKLCDILNLGRPASGEKGDEPIHFLTRLPPTFLGEGRHPELVQEVLERHALPSLHRLQTAAGDKTYRVVFSHAYQGQGRVVTVRKRGGKYEGEIRTKRSPYQALAQARGQVTETTPVRNGMILQVRHLALTEKDFLEIETAFDISTFWKEAELPGKSTGSGLLYYFDAVSAGKRHRIYRYELNPNQKTLLELLKNKLDFG